MASMRIPLHPSLQEGAETEPVGAFPKAGYLQDGKYFMVDGVKGNLVNVRPTITPLQCFL